MRLRAVLRLAIAALLSDTTGTRLAADPKPPEPATASGVIFKIVPEDTRCPAATHIMKSCENDPGTFMVFDNPNRRHNSVSRPPSACHPVRPGFGSAGRPHPAPGHAHSL